MFAEEWFAISLQCKMMRDKSWRIGSGHILLNEIVLSGLFSNASLFLWIAPGVIGSIAITVLSRRYRARFNGSWAIKRAALHSDLVR